MNFNRLISQILNESPVGTTSKNQWVGSLIARLCLNRDDTPIGVKERYKALYPNIGSEEQLTTDRYIYDDLANNLSIKIRKAALTQASNEGTKLTRNFLENNLTQILENAGVSVDDQIGIDIESDIMAAASGYNPDDLVPISKNTFITLIVKLVGDRLFDGLFAAENITINDFRKRSDYTKEYPFINVSNTDIEWDSSVLHELKKALPIIARELGVPYSVSSVSPRAYNPNTKVKENQRLIYTARITAQTQHGVALNFPMQRTGMGRGSGGDKRASEEIMAASANKRELVANADTVLNDTAEFGKYKYKFTGINKGLSKYESDIFETLIDTLPASKDNTYSSETLIQTCTSNNIFKVPRAVREFIRKLISVDMVQPIPIVAASRSDVDDILDLF